MTTISIDVDLDDEIDSMSKSELAELRRCIDRRLGNSGDVICDNPDRAYAALRHLAGGHGRPWAAAGWSHTRSPQRAGQVCAAPGGSSLAKLLRPGRTGGRVMAASAGGSPASTLPQRQNQSAAPPAPNSRPRRLRVWAAIRKTCCVWRKRQRQTQRRRRPRRSRNAKNWRWSCSSADPEAPNPIWPPPG